LERQIYETLSRDSKLSISTLQRTFKYFLEKAPKVKIIKRSAVNLRLDATYFNMFCVVVYQDDFDGHTQLLRFSNKEDYAEIREDLENLIHLGVQLESITTDGHKSILKAMKLGVPEVTTQRCLVHIQRMCLIWLTRRPKHPAAKELRKMVLDLLRINTENDRIYWTNSFRKWYESYQDYINEKVFQEETCRYWYRHRLLRRSYYLINKALPNMFHYLTNKSIPRTTNGIEGYFSHLKNHLDLHRGLTIKNRMNFIKWYVHFSNEK
jgi:AraC-like DNA-binding protein